MYIIGIDIGTTTISLALLERESGQQLQTETINHRSLLKAERPEMKIQDPERIWTLMRDKLAEWIRSYGRPAGIGFTGQMHGMLYVDGKGTAVSPLYTWQDGSGNLMLQNGKSCLELLKEKTQYRGLLATGYGLVTHDYLAETGQIPAAAVGMTTISDYMAMRLCGLEAPVIGTDMAASWGLFDLKKKDFDIQALERAGCPVSYLPEVRRHYGIQGSTRAADGIPADIPVSVSIGDNQASFLGAVSGREQAVVVNVGTGGQVSYVSEGYLECGGNLELRPYMDDNYLLVGTALCGGRAYAMLEQFYREAAGAEQGDYYGRMSRQAQEFLEQFGEEAAWSVQTTFSGTRAEPGKRGSITGISAENFHPGALTVGVMKGILSELWEQYEEMAALTGIRAQHLIGSGNGIRKNLLMQTLAEKMFGLPMELPAVREEAACGAAERLRRYLIH